MRYLKVNIMVLLNIIIILGSMTSYIKNKKNFKWKKI
jgi:hypothetical protein